MAIKIPTFAILDPLWQLLIAVWSTFSQMSPYLLFGFLVAGILSVVVSAKLVERHLGKRGLWPVVKASLLGVPLPLCSCGVIPVAMSLRKHGASNASTTAFLVSTPQTGVDSIAVTFSLLGPVFAIFRPIAAMVNGLVSGASVAFLERNDDQVPTANDQCHEECCSDDGRSSWIVRILRYGFITLPRDIARPLLIGILVASVIALLVPDDFFSGTLGKGIGGMLLMLVMGIPLYVCATASVPVAAVLIAKGVSPGAALVFLMTGPATNAATIATIWKIMGRRTAIVYLTTVALSALLSGIILNAVYSYQGGFTVEHVHEFLPPSVRFVSAIILLGVLALAVYPKKSSLHKHEAAATLVFEVNGMHCQQCARSIEREVASCTGVQKVRVDLDRKRITVEGSSIDSRQLQRQISELGYQATERTGGDPAA